MARHWQGHGPEFALEWGGRTWVLRVDDTAPGLRVRDEPVGPLLALDGLSARGRCDPHILSGAHLVHWECLFDRVVATYTPPGWGGLTVRAGWRPCEVEGVDLEIQVSAQTVDELRAVEVRIASVLPEPAPSSRPRRWVEPRDVRSAALSYDGREGDARGLTTLPPCDAESPMVPRVIPSPWVGEGSYIEMVHPDDVARRITEAGRSTSLGHTTRYGLFGHDLEKGVVLRARLRGLWTRSATARDDALGLHERFLSEPPPLGP